MNGFLLAIGNAIVIVLVKCGSRMDMKNGIYENIITKILKNKLEEMETEYFIGQQPLKNVAVVSFLSRFLNEIIKSALESFKDGEIDKQIDLSNSFILWLSEYLHNNEIEENLIDTQANMLTALFEKTNPIAANFEKYITNITPITGLSVSELFTGSNSGFSLESEIKKEILSSDEICWLVSFIKWTGILSIRDELKQFANSGRKIKVITTSYMGASDFKAIDFIAKLPNSEVKMSYNIDHERLHAKTYIFRRKSNFSTAYIGSSNLSRSALTNGLEWNLKVTTQEIPHIIEKFNSTFETYWNSPEFELYDANDTVAVEKLKKSLSLASNDRQQLDEMLFFDIEPRIHQKEILEKLQIQRDFHNRYRNLVVAATGTGKTMISAFDFKKFKKNNAGVKLLFVAHREEILRQSLQVFRGVLRDSSFGELWVGGETPQNYNQLFVSVQTLKNRIDDLDLSSEFYDYIIVDEVHHIAASSYRPILHKFNPKILLGLTATPERLDGANILEDFCGVIAAELRLTHAINERYLCPFQYFGIDDDVDLSGISWQRGRYDNTELTKLYTANEVRVDHIIRNMDDILIDFSSMKALAFCVSRDHANYMNDQFSKRKIASAVLTSSNSKDRVSVRNKLVSGEINVLFVVDIFNEGVDIPEVNTVLFLRPTESLTVFLQQLGRGLRLTENKDCLTVLDFVGNAHVEYDFVSKFRAIIGKTHNSVETEIDQGFPHLPLGCSIILQKQAKETILSNIRKAIVNKSKIIRWIQRYQEQTQLSFNLNNFLFLHQNVLLEDIYKKNGGKYIGWNTLCKEANGGVENSSDVRNKIYRAITNSFLQLTSRSYLLFILKLLRNNFEWDESDLIQNQMAMMVYYDFWQEPGAKFGFSSIKESFLILAKEVELIRECALVLELLLNKLDVEELSMDIGVPIALKLHARYNKSQILAAFYENNFAVKSSNREGVLKLKDSRIELLFVTLNKDEKKYSPTTLYRDYAINEELFHWQTQNSARPDKGKGLSYIDHQKDGKKIILFVREYDKVNRKTMGYINIGLVNYEDFKGSKPMNITWRLEEPLPTYLWEDAAKLAIK